MHDVSRFLPQNTRQNNWISDGWKVIDSQWFGLRQRGRASAELLSHLSGITCTNGHIHGQGFLLKTTCRVHLVPASVSALELNYSISNLSARPDVGSASWAPLTSKFGLRVIQLVACSHEFCRAPSNWQASTFMRSFAIIIIKILWASPNNQYFTSRVCPQSELHLDFHSDRAVEKSV